MLVSTSSVAATDAGTVSVGTLLLVLTMEMSTDAGALRFCDAVPSLRIGLHGSGEQNRLISLRRVMVRDGSQQRLGRGGRGIGRGERDDERRSACTAGECADGLTGVGDCRAGHRDQAG